MTGKLALVVEDQALNARLLAVLAERCGVQARVATNGLEALQMMRAHTPDLVLLDLLMPLMSGEELLAAMRDDPDLRGVPVIIVSTVEELDETIGALPHLCKPFEPAEVMRLIRQVLAGHSA